MKTIAILIVCFASAALAEVPRFAMKDVGASSDPKSVEVRGVAAGAFDPAIWEAGTLHLLPDSHKPVLEPRPGKFRNIYAPSIVQVGEKWRIYYGGWDGVPTGNDRIYLTETADFFTFSDRRTVIEHGKFQHVCNVNVVPTDHGFAMVCTAFPDAHRRNKPATFFSEDGVRFNGADGAFAASREQIIAVEGYPNYANADINGLNVLLHETGIYRLYFANFHDFGKIYRASSADGKRFEFDGKVLDGALAINDVKKFRVGENNWYLMGLHMNGDRMYYSVSRDGMKFPEARMLAMHETDADRFIVAVGFVTSGEQDEPGRKVMGVMYGAGAMASLNQNRIFARWLQKRIVFTAGERKLEPGAALGPDRQVLGLTEDAVGTVEVFADDGKTLVGRGDNVTLKPGRAYEVARIKD
jgi:hypothetical protein